MEKELSGLNRMLCLDTHMRHDDTTTKTADPTKLTKAKRMQKIEPLYDRFNPPNSWRLSRRKG